MPRRREATPGHRPPAVIWVLFDHGNGLDGSKNYTFWFETRQKALVYKRWLDKQRARGKNIVDTTGPFKYVLDGLRKESRDGREPLSFYGL